MGRVAEFFRRLLGRRPKKEAGILECNTTQHNVLERNITQQVVAQQSSVTVTEVGTTLESGTNAALSGLEIATPDDAGKQLKRCESTPSKFVPSRHRSIYLQKPLGDIRAVRKMKHGHQAPWYRKSVKAKVRPEEEED